MVIQHNMSAMNANRQLGLITGSLAKSTEQLSSGYKINRAADDAAGLSISEKMRKQIRGLDQASENIEDGISLCQVADGALNETVAILQRMRELAVQSANGTNSASDRQSIEMEITQLKTEVDRIAETTKFNDAVYPLNAPVTYSEIVTETIEAPSNGNQNDGLLHETTITFKTNYACTYDGKSYNAGDTITITGLTTNDTEIWIDGGVAWAGFSGNDPMSWDTSTYLMEPLKISDLKTNENGYLYYLDRTGVKRYPLYAIPPAGPDPLEVHDMNSATGLVSSGRLRFMTADDLSSQKSAAKPIIQTSTRSYFSSNEGVSVHSGASASQTNKIPVNIVNATCKGLGITDITLATEDSSTGALRFLNTAIFLASSYRSAFGAAQNRLEHAQRIDDNTSENTQAAESQIRDTDMAAEMVKYSNTNILAQTGQSMLAQANQSSQGVLSLIA